ncbi:(4Fe-4S)-binding protein [Geobacter sulfurreducens]|nr:(4Fe-4S)-binding protein [Geobacter sulfurreducens]
MTEIVIISGKGGTGKTSLTASFAALAPKTVVADCDVDAADLHLILAPRILQRTDFISGHEAVIRGDACTGCGTCRTLCRFEAVSRNGSSGRYEIGPAGCEGCGVCVHFCPAKAIDFPQRLCGEWYVSETRFGPMVHARLGIAAENSGKLVSLVRKEAQRLAVEREADLLLVDGPPGIGCPVIASITGVDLVLVVTEPTRSGKHDLERVLRLARHFKVPACVCVNKWDINPELTEQIENESRLSGATVLGRIPYDRTVTAAQIAGQSATEYGGGPASKAILEIWETLRRMASPTNKRRES